MTKQLYFQTTLFCYDSEFSSLLSIHTRMNTKLAVSPKAFEAIQTVNTNLLSELTENELRPLLPSLVRMSLCTPLDQSQEWSNEKKTILRVLSGLEQVNSLVALLSIDFQTLEADFKKEQQLRAKIGVLLNDSSLITSVQDGMALDFERSEATRRLRLLLYELLYLIAQVKEARMELYPSELFDSDVYLEEVADVLCIAKAEFPSLLQTQEIAEALVHVTNGPGLICRLVTNIPDTFIEVCTTLILNGEKEEESSKLGKSRMQTLLQLCHMNMSQAKAVRAKAAENCSMPGLTILLTLDYAKLYKEETPIGDLVSFVSSLLLGTDDKVRTWFSQYIRQTQKKSDVISTQKLREELLLYLKSMDVSPSTQNLVQVTSLLRLYCALRGIANLKFNENEIELIMKLITSRPAPSPAGIRFVSLGLCMVLACPTLILSCQHEKQVVDWIKWLLKEETFFGSSSGSNGSFGEMLLLIAIHFHSNQIDSISELVCSTLGMKVSVRSNNLGRLKILFTQELFTDQAVTSYAVKVPVTPNLNKYTHGFLPVHCIHQLLRSRAFTKFKVPIKDWIYKQVCSAISPLHPLLPDLIEVYVNSVLIPSSKSALDTTNEPISEVELMAVFNQTLLASSSSISRNQSSIATPQLLLLYYLLLYEDTRLANMKSIAMADRKVKQYSPQFMAGIPIFYLVQMAYKEQHNYTKLFSPLLRLLAAHYPHLCLVEHWFNEESSPVFQHPITAVPKKDITKGELETAFKKAVTTPFKLGSHFNYLNTLPLPQLWPFVETFVGNLPLLLESEVPHELLTKASKLWWRFNTIFPRRLWVMTINAFRARPNPQLPLRPLTLDDITLEPLHVLRCDMRIFRCAPLLVLVLHMLQAFLASSKIHLYHHTLQHPILEKKGPIEGEKDREELRVALVSAQESAALQILLECCCPTKQDLQEVGLLTSLREVQSLICSHLHQVFILDPTLVKLVHFQGYPSELLPVVVSSVPSMHICIDFLPELLSQPMLDKQIFAVELASYLCLQHSIPKSLSIAKLCINVCNTMLEILSSDQRSIFFTPVLPALVRMCQAFPPLSEDVTRLLLHLGKSCLSQTCVTNASLADVDFSWNSSYVDKSLGFVVNECFHNLCEIVTIKRNIY